MSTSRCRCVTAPRPRWPLHRLPSARTRRPRALGSWQPTALEQPAGRVAARYDGRSHRHPAAHLRRRSGPSSTIQSVSRARRLVIATTTLSPLARARAYLVLLTLYAGPARLGEHEEHRGRLTQGPRELRRCLAPDKWTRCRAAVAEPQPESGRSPGMAVRSNCSRIRPRSREQVGHASAAESISSTSSRKRRPHTGHSTPTSPELISTISAPSPAQPRTCRPPRLTRKARRA